MCGKPLSKNLASYISGLSGINIPVYVFDRNETKQLPCITIGYDGESMSFPGGLGHYTVDNYINICVQGYEDPSNATADSYLDIILNGISNTNNLYAALNKPVSGTDTRPITAFHCNGYLIRSVDRTEEGTSEEISIRSEVFCAARAQ